MFFRRLEARCVPSRLLVTEHLATGHPVNTSFPLFGSTDLHPKDCSKATPRLRLAVNLSSGLPSRAASVCTLKHACFMS
jgi:hypothetical protein